LYDLSVVKFTPIFGQTDDVLTHIFKMFKIPLEFFVGELLCNQYTFHKFIDEESKKSWRSEGKLTRKLPHKITKS
jgi:hypothetical protein